MGETEMSYSIKCCYQCPDRVVTKTYNCHSTCDKYLSEKAEHDRIKELIRKDQEKNYIKYRK